MYNGISKMGVYACTSVHVLHGVCTCMCVCMYECACGVWCIQVCVCTCVCMYECAYAIWRIQVCVSVCMHVQLYMCYMQGIVCMCYIVYPGLLVVA